MSLRSLVLGLDVSPRRLGWRFAEKVEINEDGCWMWTAASTKGYGQFKVDGRQCSAHRVSYEHFVGPIPDGLVLDHLCRKTLCVNPLHLEAVTNAENIHRGQVGELERAKTHCPSGHPYDSENTYSWKNGWRQCRKCKRAAHDRWIARRNKP